MQARLPARGLMLPANESTHLLQANGFQPSLYIGYGGVRDPLLNESRPDLLPCLLRDSI